MKTIINLEQNDIQEIIAKHFNVEVEKVNLEPYQTMVGFYKNEHYESRVRCEVEVENKTELI